MKKYCASITEYKRFPTRVVSIGDIPLGGNNPIRIQSMTTTDTMDTNATVEQTIRMIDAGCEYVRITAPSLNEARNLTNIKDGLKKRGYNVPLIADIHFTPNAAEEAARIVEKVRVNPGNYADKKKFQQIEYTDSQYEAEIERIRERFSPLVKICKEYGTAMRIGTNHGSLSDRIMSRYGDTPLGMVESALEFVRICEDLNYYDIVLSMKASNTQVMVQAYRLLTATMIENNMNYPIHLGVTEAGDGEDGRIKSAVGIGALLEDGIGDTIRVSLTEEPEAEAPVAIQLAERYKSRKDHEPIPSIGEYRHDPFSYNRIITDEIFNTGGSNVPRVVIDFSGKEKIGYPDFEEVGYRYLPDLDKWSMKDIACDYLYLGSKLLDIEPPENLHYIFDHEYWLTLKSKKNCYPLIEYSKLQDAKLSDIINFIRVNSDDILHPEFDISIKGKRIVLLLTTNNRHGMPEQRRAFLELRSKRISVPVVIERVYNDLSKDQFRLYSATDCGALFIDGFGDGIFLRVKDCDPAIKENFVNATSFGILQASRVRISKTEYIACPSCGRTLFDLVEVTNKIRSRTEHLKGVKIGIMGCIVNGPGEMADADYGYVGSGPGKITLYKGQNVVRKSVDSQSAVDELIEIIKEDGNWVEPSPD